MEQLSLCDTPLIEPVLCGPRAAWSVKTCEAHVSWSRDSATGKATVVRSPSTREGPLSATREKNGCSKEDPTQPKINKQCEARGLAKIFVISTFFHSGSRAFPVRNEKSLIQGLIVGFPHLPNLLTAFSICFWGSDSKSAVTWRESYLYKIVCRELFVSKSPRQSRQTWFLCLNLT